MALPALRNETSKGSLRSKRQRASLAPSFRPGLLLALAIQTSGTGGQPEQLRGASRAL